MRPSSPGYLISPVDFMVFFPYTEVIDFIFCRPEFRAPFVFVTFFYSGMIAETL
jgi:hypothetical protein